MFENKTTEVGGIHYTRYIESWRNAGGKMFCVDFFVKWLKAEGCTDEEIRDIKRLCIGGGKLELEMSAKPFVQEQKEYIYSHY